MRDPSRCTACGDEMTSSAMTDCLVAASPEMPPGVAVVTMAGEFLHLHDTLLIHRTHPKLDEVLRLLGFANGAADWPAHDPWSADA